MIQCLLKPNRIEEYRANGWDITRHYYSRQRVLAKERTKAFQAAKARSQKARQSRTPEAAERRHAERMARYERKYRSADATLLDAAMRDACEAMFNLNRYAKHRSCTADNRDEIYALKHQLVKVLYLLRFGIGCIEHRVPGKQCYRCDGTGYGEDGYDSNNEDEYDDNYGGGCRRCGGSGWYHRPTVLMLFRFEIDGKKYAWHMPEGKVDFRYETTCEPADWQNEAEEKPLNLAPSRFAEAKALVRWVIQNKQRVALFKEQIRDNLAFKPGHHLPHGEPLADKLARLGDDVPVDTVKDIRAGSVPAQEIFCKLRKERLLERKQVFARQLGFHPPAHKSRGLPLDEKILLRIPKGTPSKRRLAEDICTEIRTGSLSYRQALATIAEMGMSGDKDAKQNSKVLFCSTSAEIGAK
jgi:hypothetical protein